VSGQAFTRDSVARFSVSFTDTLGAAVDPATVVFKYMTPDGTVTTKTYGTDAFPVKDSAGHYHADFTLNQAGTWRWKWLSTSPGASAEGSLTVHASSF
jgi:hypothetical protein